MKLSKSIGWIPLLFALLSPGIARSQSCNVTCSSKDQTAFCVRDAQSWNCNCGNEQQQKKMLTDFIQAKEGIDKSQIDNLDEVISKAIEESSQKVGTPINFTVKVRPQAGKTESTSQYTIKTSEQ